MTHDQDEQVLVDALHRTHVTQPDLAETARRATRQGTRLRHRHQAGVGFAVLAVAGVSVGGAALLAPGGQDNGRATTPAAGSTTPKVSTAAESSPAAVTSPAPQGFDTSSAYAVLDAPGWTAPESNVIADEKLYYVQDGTDASVSLNWRPVTLGSKFTLEQLQAELDSRYGGQEVVATTTIDGDDANVFRAGGGHFNVVGSIKQGRFLTLSSAGLTVDEVVELATHVHRQAAAHLTGDQQ